MSVVPFPNVHAQALLNLKPSHPSSRGVTVSSVPVLEMDFGYQGAEDAAMPQPTSVIAKRLEATREALGLSAAELCRQIDIKPNRWSQYESGERRITEEVASRLCDRFRLTLDWIYRGDASGLPRHVNIRHSA